MKLPFVIVFEPPTRADVRRWFRRGWSWPRVAALICCTGVLGCGIWLRIHAAHQAPTAPAFLNMHTTPAGAAVSLDGHGRGTTPATLSLAAGKHQVRLHLAGYADAEVAMTARPGETAQVQRQFWPANVRVLPVAAPMPGAQIVTADFLADGRVAVEVQLSSGGRQLWLADTAGDYRRVGPAIAQGAVAISPDGGRVAYLTASQQTALSFTNSVDTVTLAAVDGTQLKASSIVGNGVHPVDLAWAPDGKRLLIVARQQAAVGGATSRLLILDPNRGQSRPVVQLPATVVEGSYTWSPNDQAVAFLTQSNSVTSLCAADLQTGAFRYLGDVARGSNTRPTFPPIAWSTDSDQVVFSEPSSNHGGWPFGSHQTLQLVRGSIARGSSPWTEADAQSPLWLSDGQVLAFTRPKHDGPLVVRSFDSSGRGQDVATVPIKADTYWARWDAAHRQALLAVLGGGLDGAAETTYWLVQFTTERAS
ncbi:MAG: PEGA domain-containing protein [Chloroflexota bacterium]